MRILNAKAELIQALIVLGLMAVGEALQQEVEYLAGPRYDRHGSQPGHVRWSHKRGAVYLLDLRIRISYQRVRDQRRNADVPLVSAPVV